MYYNIYLFRHGRTNYNIKGVFTGFKDSNLTKSGIDDAKLIALRLKDKKINIAFQTKLSRSKDTLKEVLKFHPECKKVIIDNRMIERGYGNLEGQTHYEFTKKNSPELYDYYHRSYDGKPPKGESIKMVEKRVLSFIKDLKKYIKENKCIEKIW